MNPFFQTTLLFLSIGLVLWTTAPEKQGASREAMALADQASGDSGQWTPARTDSTAPTRAGEEPHNSRTARRADDATSLQLLQDGVHSLSVAKDLPESYLSPYVDESPSIAWADKKPVFQV